MENYSENEKLNKAITILLPCLNEESVIGICVKKAKKVIEKLGVSGEVLVVDNASTDNSAAIAKECGAGVIVEQRRGYGLALRRGIKEAAGDVIIMIDADTTYDFGDIPAMYKMLADGTADMVIGNRFAGGMRKGAMSLSHRLGVRFLSFLGRKKFHTDVYDFHSGLRGLTASAASRLHFETSGMEFATEMIAVAAKNSLRIGQMPVSLRRCKYERKSKLHTIRDGLRHLKYIIM